MSVRSDALEQRSADRHSYGQILKSSVLIGGSSILNIAIGIVRTKAMAVLLGPAGIGLMGMYTSIADLTRSIAGMGVNSSGVRQIAEAVSSGDIQRIARTAAVLRRISILLGLVGGALLIAFSNQAANLTFGSNQHAVSVALLSAAVFFQLVADGRGALIQGMRRISDLAKMGVLGALLGTILSISLVYFLREGGIALVLVAIAGSAMITSWWYSRKLSIESRSMTTSEVKREATSLLKLGLAFMASGFLMIGAAYAVRTILLRNIGIEAAGFYQSAWTLGGLYVGFVLQAMGADFYPRLVGVIKDHAQCNRLVNEQAEVSLLLAGPGVIATLTFAPLVIGLFYSSEFAQAVDILRWICIGMALRVITWPMGFIVVAKNKQTLFIATEFAWTLVNVCLSWLCVRSFGMNGAGIAFFGSYVFHWLMIYPIVRHLSGFRWSTKNRRTILIFVSMIASVFCGFLVLPSVAATVIGALATLLAGFLSARNLLSLYSPDRIPRPIRGLLVRFQFVSRKPIS
jgi:enterobacterial common antigen flippase